MYKRYIHLIRTIFELICSVMYQKPTMVVVWMTIGDLLGFSFPDGLVGVVIDRLPLQIWADMRTRFHFCEGLSAGVNNLRSYKEIFF